MGIEKAKPYYQDEWVTIYHGDCREILLELEDNSIDLVLTDPPYESDFLWAYSCIAEGGARVLREGGSLFAYAGTMYLPDIIGELTEHLTWVWLFNLHHHQFSRIWHHKIMLTSKPIVALSKGNNSVMNWLRTDLTAESADKHFHKRWGQSVGIPCLIISKVTEANAVVLDPFLGGGTFAMASKMLGRKCIGIEIEEKYCEIAANRCRQMVFNFAQ